MHVFFYANKAATGDLITLDKDESQHCLRVLRHKAGDEVFVTNGQGERYQCTIESGSPQSATLRVAGIESFSKSFSVHIAIAPTKQPDRIEWFLEKACELGVDEVTFLDCEHSVRNRLKLDRLEKITVSALKQSKNFFKARVNDLIKFDTFLERHQEQRNAFIAIADQPIENHLLRKIQPGQAGLLLIGPEGDFSTTEIKKAVSSGFGPVSLGESVLRTETAGLIGCHLFHVANL